MRIITVLTLVLIAIGVTSAADYSKIIIKHYPLEEKSLKVEISKMWKDGWYPRGLSSDGNNQITVLFMKAEFPLYSDWLIKITSTSSPASIKQDTMTDIKNGWTPADVTVAGGKTIFLFLKEKELIRMLDNGPGSPEIITLDSQGDSPVKVKYAPYVLYSQNGKNYTLKFNQPADFEMSWALKTYPQDDAALMKGIGDMSDKGYQPWAIEQGAGGMTVLFVKY